MLKLFRHRPPPPTTLLSLFDLADLNRRPRRENEAVIRGLCANAYLGDGAALCRVLGRYKMFIDTRDRGLSSHLMLDGYWEMWLTEALASVLRPGMVAVDIGANLGYFTMLMAELVGKGGRVHAFEPNAALAGRLRRTADLNGFWHRVEVHEQALGEDEGEGWFSIPEGEPKNGYIVRPGTPRDGEGFAVTTRRLDSYAELAEADVLKIDADTSEQAIWRGMRGLLERDRALTIFLEFAADRYADPGGFIDEITAHGFTLARVPISGGPRPATRATILEQPAHEDVILMLRRG